jgi:serine/threonine-protein kinase
MGLEDEDRPSATDPEVDATNAGGAMTPDSGPASDEVTLSFAPASSSVFAELAERLGHLPQVLLRDPEATERPATERQPAPGRVPPVGDRPSRYELLGEIDRGGMGAVLRGRDRDLGRELAIKVLLEKYKDRPEVVRRFVEEAQIGGQLQHPGIVPVYELGTFADRRPFFAMKLVKGRTLADLLRQRTGPAAELPRFLAIFEAVCQTMAYAHARGVVHRDLKPSNVMVGSFGEVQVMDWGLAKVLPRPGAAGEEATADDRATVIATVRSGSDRDASQAGSLLGTPAYMPPEQARGETDGVDERADVFALGAVLCEILTGQPAYVGGSAEELVRQAAGAQLAGALERLDGCGADGELVALAKQCLAPAREARPRDARQVAGAITAYLTGVAERLKRAELAWVEAQARAEEERKRQRLTVGLAASVLALAGVVGGTWLVVERSRVGRRAAVAQALGEARRLQAVARAADPDEPSRWAEALAALERAQGLLAQGGEPEQRRQAEALKDAISSDREAARAEAEGVIRLIDIRSAWADDPYGSATEAAYSTEFHEVGIDPDVLTAEEAGARIRSHKAGVVQALIAALDTWAAVRRERRSDAAGARRLAAAARIADPDPWRDRLREALDRPAGKDRLAALRELARTARMGELDAVTLDLLGATLFEAGDAPAAKVLLSGAQRLHPRDVWLNYDLARCLEKLGKREEAIRYYTAARALRPETAHELAHALEEQGEPDEAIAVFRDLAALRPKNGRHLSCLGRALKARGRSQEATLALAAAVAALREAIRSRPDDAIAHNNLSLALDAQGKPEEAIAEARATIRLRPDVATYHNNLALALRSRDKVEEAIAEFRTAIRLDPDYVGARNGLGGILCDVKHDYPAAEAVLRAAVRLAPDYADAHNNLGVTLRSQGKLEEAIAEFHTALRLRPDDALTHSNLGLALAARGKLEEANAELRAAIRLNPHDPRAHTNIGITLMDHGKMDLALDEFRAVVRLQPDEANAHNNLGEALRRAGRLEEAAAECRAALQLKPDLDGAHNNLGLILMAQGKPEEANAECRTALRLNPDSAEAHNNLATILREQGKAEEAIAEFRAALRLQPGLGAAHNNLARTLRAQRKLEEAISEYRNALRLGPPDAATHYDLGGALRERGEVEEAIAEFRAALRLDPGLAEAHNALGAILCDVKRDHAGAEAEFRAALRLRPDDPEFHFNLGNALRGQRKLAEAAAEYHEALRLEPNTPGPTITSASRWPTRGSWRRRSPNTAPPSGCVPTAP